jgi:CBS domain-containing protein
MSKPLLKMALKPAVSIERNASVMAAIGVMHERRVGAAVVLQRGRAEGIFTERDLMVKVVLKKLDPEKTPVSVVMTSPVVPIGVDASIADALRVMVDLHVRHLPVIDEGGQVVGMLSMRHLMREQIDRLEQHVGALENYIGTEGIAGG